MNASHDVQVWLSVLADRKATREDARARLAPLAVKPPTAKQLAEMKHRAAILALCKSRRGEARRRTMTTYSVINENGNGYSVAKWAFVDGQEWVAKFWTREEAEDVARKVGGQVVTNQWFAGELARLLHRY